MILGDAELEVSLFAPVGTPRVADFPVLRALVLVVLCVLTISDKGYRMINFDSFGCKAARAVGLSDDT